MVPANSADILPNATLSRLRSLARRFLIVTLVVVGALCGLIAVVFERYVELAREYLIGHALSMHEPYRTGLIVVIPPVVFGIIALMMRRFAPRAVGANLARVRMAYNEDPKLLGWRSILATFTATPLSLGAGAPLGPEGPIVVITSGVSGAVARTLRLPKKIVRGMIPVGVAAGIAAVFNTPITGVVFALEEVFGAADRGLLGGVLVGAVAAAVVEKSFLGGHPLLAAPFSTWNDPRELIGFAGLGAFAGIVSGLAIAAIHRLKRAWAKAMPSVIPRVAAAGLLIAGAGLIAPSILGVGYDTVSFWLRGGGTAQSAAIAFVVKVVAFVIAISAGVLGGSFAPSLFIGAALGAVAGHSVQNFFPGAGIDPKAYAIVGMGSFFAGLLRSPIAAVLIAIELTRDYDLVVPLMLGVSLAVAISRRISRFSIVEQQMIDEGYVEGRESQDPLARVRAAEAMTATVVALHADETLGAASGRVGVWRHRMYPVVESDERLAGVVPREALERSAASTPLREIMEKPKLVAVAADELIEVVRRMQLTGVDRCPVVDDDAANHLVGFITPADILRSRIAHAHFSKDEADFDLFDTSTTP